MEKKNNIKPKVDKVDNIKPINKGKTATNKSLMIESLGKGNFITTAIMQVGISRETHYIWLREDPDYAQAVKESKETRINILERTALKHATQGNAELIKFLLKSWKPAEYHPENQINLSQVIINHEENKYNELSPEQLSAELARRRQAISSGS